jgi:hypothetical protein
VIVAAEVLNCSVFDLLREPEQWIDWAMLHLDAVNYREQERAAHGRHLK